MATLLYGPRLGNPSHEGFSVWAQYDGAASVKLQVRKTNAFSWNDADSDSVDTTKSNTIVLTVTGLDPTTKYDYRLETDGVAGTTYTTITMPPSGGGRWVLYNMADFHGNETEARAAYQSVYDDYTTTYEPLGIPAIMLHMGDFHMLAAGDDIPTAVSEITRMLSFDTSMIMAKIPFLYMWDDWDFIGNNGNRVISPNPAFGGSRTDAMTVWDYMWRDHPQPAAPSVGYSFEIAGVPLIVADGRSQKSPTGTSGLVSLIYGGETLIEGVSTCWGAAQRTWLKGLIAAYSRKSLVLFVSTHTIDNIVTPYTSNGFGGASRDSMGIFHVAERNDVMQTAIAAGYGVSHALLFMCADDHRNTVRWCDFGPPFDRTATNIDMPGLGIGLPHLTVCCNSGPQVPVSPTETLFGLGNVFDWSGGYYPTVQRFDINSIVSGEHTTARITWIHTTGDQTPPGANGIPTDANGHIGDLFVRDGTWTYYDAATSGVQTYPPDNGTGKRTFTESYVDDILGTLHKRDEAVRNTTGQLRRADDGEGEDRDDILAAYTPRTEMNDEDEP